MEDVASLNHDSRAHICQNSGASDPLPAEVLTRKDGFTGAATRHFELLGSAAKRTRFLVPPCPDHASTRVSSAKMQLSTDLNRHFQPLGSRGVNSQGQLTSGRKHHPNTRSRYYNTACWLRSGTIESKVRGFGLGASLSIQLSPYCHGSSTRSSSIRPGYLTLLLVSQTEPFVLRCYIAFRMLGDFPSRLSLVWNRRYRTNASSTNGSGSSSGQGGFNSGAGGQYNSESPDSGYDLGDQNDSFDNFVMTNSKVLFEEEWDKLLQGLNATEHSQAPISDQPEDPQPPFNGQPSLSVPSQVPLLQAPQYDLALPSAATNYDIAPEPPNSTLHNPPPSTNVVHPQAPLSAPLHEWPFINTFVAGPSDAASWQAYPSLSFSQPFVPPYSAGSQPVSYTAAGPSSQQSHPGQPISHQEIDTISPASTHAGSNSTLSTEPTSTPPRRRGGRKPSNNKCSQCPRSFDRPSLLTNHMFTHTGVKGECGISFLDGDFLLNSVYHGLML
ncbi:hypothetical protein BDV93DRAFT_157805 [Ceratobasidium sp. AG-I]|nr:hypothetical protein BDV93DRAFT_157805 [Ceratobasidium sp. AG-I]